MNFIFNLKEREDFVEFCFDNEFLIIPDIDYEDNSYYRIKNLEHYHKYMNESVRFFITSEKYQTHPLEMDTYDKDNKRVYYIKQRYGGPSIDFTTPFFAEKKYNKVGPGLISIYPFYYHYNEKFIPDNELKKVYGLLTAYIRKKSKRVRVGKKSYWIGINTIERVKEAALNFVAMDGLDLSTIL